MTEMVKKERSDVYWLGSSGSMSTAQHKFTRARNKLTLFNDEIAFYEQDTTNFLVCPAGSILVPVEKAPIELDVTIDGRKTVVNIPEDEVEDEDGAGDEDSNDDSNDADDASGDDDEPTNDDDVDSDDDSEDSDDVEDESPEEPVKVLGKKKGKKGKK